MFQLVHKRAITFILKALGTFLHQWDDMAMPPGSWIYLTTILYLRILRINSSSDYLLVLCHHNCFVRLAFDMWMHTVTMVNKECKCCQTQCNPQHTRTKVTIITNIKINIAIVYFLLESWNKVHKCMGN